ncbi:ribonuclease activity regulator RraA [Paenarthrobacter ilicis]|uniref:RraA family protein n=1 Tax=Paenarthrobacter ilicis TaxID=43665 RepID=UPI0028D7A109|nr:ribonuclease activity regulator RraA [Paenarthrobacter ilicis]
MSHDNQHIPLDDEVFELLSRASTSTLATQLFKKGIRQPFLVGLSPVGDGFDGFVGEAYTMRFIPAREDIDPLDDPYRTGNVLQWEAIEQVGPRQVIVVDSRGDTSAASAGDMLITRAMNRGAAGFVTDGALRDGHAIAQMGFPAYAQCITATTRPASFHVAELQVPIGCAGVAVYPGDVLVGDRDGIIVVPRALATELATPAAEQEALEQYLHNRVRAGESLWGVYPPDENTLDDYRAWQQDQRITETEKVKA